MSEKKLSGWLIASDIDGTLNDKSRRLVKRNYDAIHKYIDEYGGNFTLASGRNPESMRKHFKRLDIADGKAVVINGANVTLNGACFAASFAFGNEDTFSRFVLLAYLGLGE